MNISICISMYQYAYLYEYQYTYQERTPVPLSHPPERNALLILKFWYMEEALQHRS